MSDIAWILIIVGTSSVGCVATGVIVAQRLNKRIEGFASIRQAIEKTQAEFEAIRRATIQAAQNLQRGKHQLSQVEGRTKQLVELEGRANQIHDMLKNGHGRLETLKSEITEKREERTSIEEDVHQVKSELDLYSRIADFADYGIYEEPEYLYETSERYKSEIKRVRDEQKDLIRKKTATELPKGIEVNGSSQKGTAILVSVLDFIMCCNY